MKSTSINPTGRELTRRIIACESENEELAGVSSAGFRACDKLRRPPSTLTGTLGYRALIVRALTMAKRESELLESARVKEDGSLADISSDAMTAGNVLGRHLHLS